MNRALEYEHEQEHEDGTTEMWTILYEVEPPSRGGRDEPPSGGCTTIYEIRSAAGVVVPTSHRAANGFDEHLIERIEERCYESWVDAQESARDAEADRRYDEVKDRRAEE